MELQLLFFFIEKINFGNWTSCNYSALRIQVQMCDGFEIMYISARKDTLGPPLSMPLHKKDRYKKYHKFKIIDIEI